MIKKILQEKKFTGILSIGSFVSGTYFIRESGITGNVISNNLTNPYGLSFIGISLIFCSLLLLIYTLKR